MALFTINQADGLISAPTDAFSPTSEKPANDNTLVKGDGPYCVHGLIGLWKNENQGSFYVKENGQPLTSNPNSSWAENNLRLKGRTIYGYKITFGNFPFYQGVSSQNAICIDFKTDYQYHLTNETQETIFGNSGIELTPGFYSATINTDPQNKGALVFPSLGQPLAKFIPLCFTYFQGSSSKYFYIKGLGTKDDKWVPAYVSISESTVTNQYTDENAMLLSQGKIITVSNQDATIQSLEDRVTKLEDEMSKVPSSIEKGFALATEKVSKVYVSR